MNEGIASNSESEREAGVAAQRRTLWAAFGGLAAVLVILGVSMFAGYGVGNAFEWWAGVHGPRAYNAGALEALTTAHLAVFLLTFQATMAGLTLAVAPWLGRTRAELLPLSMPARGGRTLVVSVITLLLAAAVYASAVLSIDSGAILHDVRPFAVLMQSRTWWVLLIAAAIGAPLAEELLFRGLMYGVLRTSPVGMVGAALATSFVWASVHSNYSVYGLTAIFLIGLYLAYLREKTGSLIAPIVCHGYYNASIVMVLAFAPQTIMTPG